MGMYILIALAVVLGAFLLFVASRPNNFRMARSATMTAPPQAIFSLVNDFHQWERWSPWAELDPNATMAYEGPREGVGSIYRWSGNAQVGAGSGTLVESTPGQHVGVRLEFLKPFKATNKAEFDFQPQGDHTLVTWSMSGKVPFVMKLFRMFINCDDMVGKQFDKGLAKMKAVAESGSASKPLSESTRELQPS